MIKQIPTFEALPIYSNATDIESALFSNDKKTLLVLPLALGESYHDWRYAQNVCIQLSNFKAPDIRANACLGFAYIARTKRKLDRELVLPILLRELHTHANNKGKITDAIEDIKIYLKWRFPKTTSKPGIISR